MWLHTAIECPITYAGDGVRDGNGGKARATIECIITYARDGVTDGNGSKARAIPECPITYACDGVRDGNGSKAGATYECTITYTGNGVGDDCILATCNQGISRCLYDSIAASSTIIFFISTININRSKACAIRVYKTPSFKVIVLEGSDILAGSGAGSYNETLSNGQYEGSAPEQDGDGWVWAE